MTCDSNQDLGFQADSAKQVDCVHRTSEVALSPKLVIPLAQRIHAHSYLVSQAYKTLRDLHRHSVPVGV
jgi:hypothetical protein